MKRLMAMAMLALCGGCLNMYTRAPWTEPEIVSVYQCSREAAALSVICSFPQMMSDAGHDDAFMWENCLTIPFLGLPCAADAICEACLDTVFLPVDRPLSVHRQPKENLWSR